MARATFSYNFGQRKPGYFEKLIKKNFGSFSSFWILRVTQKHTGSVVEKSVTFMRIVYVDICQRKNREIGLHLPQLWLNVAYLVLCGNMQKSTDWMTRNGRWIWGGWAELSAVPQACLTDISQSVKWSPRPARSAVAAHCAVLQFSLPTHIHPQCLSHEPASLV